MTTREPNDLEKAAGQEIARLLQRDEPVESLLIRAFHAGARYQAIELVARLEEHGIQLDPEFVRTFVGPPEPSGLD